MKPCILILTILMATLLYSEAGAQSNSGDNQKKPDKTISWKTEHLFDSRLSYEEEVTNLEELLEQFEYTCKGTLSDSSLHFERCYEEYYHLNEMVLKVYLYVYLNSMSQSGEYVNEFRSTEAQKASGLYRRFIETTSFLKPEVEDLGRELIESFLIERPALERYRYDLEQLLRRREHIVSPDSEKFMAGYQKILEQNSKVDQAIWDEITWDDYVTSKSNILKVLPIKKSHREKISVMAWMDARRSPDRDVRKNAAEAFFNSLLGSAETIAQQYITKATIESEIASVQNYHSVLEMKMDEDNIDPQIYRNLIKTVRNNLPESMHRYVALKRKVMGLDKFMVYDNYVPMVSAFKPPEVTYSQACDRVEAALEPLGKEYLGLLKKSSDPLGGWVYINTATKGGGVDRTLSFYGINPYVLLFYTDSYDDIFSVAHEFGHAIHGRLSSSQPMPYYNPSPFVAEISSSVNEVLVYEYLLANARRSQRIEEELFLIELIIDRIRMTLFRMTQMAEFENIVHQKVTSGEVLYFEYLREIYSQLMTDYYGDKDFQLSEYDGIQWAFLTHQYASFYVYSYATSISAAIEFVRLIREDAKSGSTRVRDNYLNLLREGSSDAPVEMLRRAGIDFRTPIPIQNTIDYFNSLLDDFEKLYYQQKGK